MENITFANKDGDFAIPEEAFTLVPEKKKNKEGQIVETGKLFLVAKQSNKVSELGPENCPLVTYGGKVIGRASGLTAKIPIWTPEAFAAKADAKINQSKRRTKAEVVKMKDAAAVVDFVNNHTTVKGWKFSDLSDEHQKAICTHAEKLTGEHPKQDKRELMLKTIEAAELAGNATLAQLWKDQLESYDKQLERLAKAQAAKAAKLVKKS